ncbi:Crp/Fnr family transcriptional regulator [Reyranella sp.]|uniref:Crp/Fnr family transcriptional regulator n=1 Tax=Reyranella sp. TaxID=1929291 RepID=UPI003D10AEBF
MHKWTVARERPITTPTEADMAQNGLLAVLVEADRIRLRGQMMVLDLEANIILHRAGDDVVDTWFPLGSASAAFCVEDVDGDRMDVAQIGREGAVGGIVSNGHLPAYSTAVVRFPGRFIRIRTTALEQAKLSSIALRHWFSRYSDCLMAQVFQTAVCNGRHTIKQRTAKLLLAALERTGDREIAITQEQLASIMGVGRPFISRVLSSMRQEGVIESRRLRQIIRDEKKLRSLSCGCTVLIEDHFDKVLHGIYPVS